MQTTLYGLSIGERRFLALIAVHGRHRPWHVDLFDVAQLLSSQVRPTEFSPRALKQVIDQACTRLRCCPAGPLIKPHLLQRHAGGSGWRLVVRIEPDAIISFRFLCPPPPVESTVPKVFDHALGFIGDNSI